MALHVITCMLLHDVQKTKMWHSNSGSFLKAPLFPKRVPGFVWSNACFNLTFPSMCQPYSEISCNTCNKTNVIEHCHWTWDNCHWTWETAKKMQNTRSNLQKKNKRTPPKLGCCGVKDLLVTLQFQNFICSYTCHSNLFQPREDTSPTTSHWSISTLENTNSPRWKPLSFWQGFPPKYHLHEGRLKSYSSHEGSTTLHLIFFELFNLAIRVLRKLRKLSSGKKTHTWPSTLYRLSTRIPYAGLLYSIYNWVAKKIPV